jgi:hypothetical protein
MWWEFDVRWLADNGSWGGERSKFSWTIQNITHPPVPTPRNTKCLPNRKRRRSRPIRCGIETSRDLRCLGGGRGGIDDRERRRREGRLWRFRWRGGRTWWFGYGADPMSWWTVCRLVCVGCVGNVVELCLPLWIFNKLCIIEINQN